MAADTQLAAGAQAADPAPVPHQVTHFASPGEHRLRPALRDAALWTAGYEVVELQAVTQPCRIAAARLPACSASAVNGMRQLTSGLAVQVGATVWIPSALDPTAPGAKGWAKGHVTNTRAGRRWIACFCMMRFSPTPAADIRRAADLRLFLACWSLPRSKNDLAACADGE